MRKLGIGVVLVAAALLLSSCSMVRSRLAELNRNNKSESELIDGCMEQIIEAIENKDKDAFKEIFSQEALEEAEALDEAIEFLFVTFPNGIDSWERTTIHTSDSVNYGEKTQSIDAPYDVFMGDIHYRFSILVHTIDTENPEKVGLHSFIVEDDEERERKIYEPGIQITIGDRIIPQPPGEEDPLANEKTFERSDLFFTVPAGLESQTFADTERSVYVYFERNGSDTPGSGISVSSTRSSWDSINGSASLETDLDGTPVLTPQSVISQYAVELEPEVTAVLDTGKLTVDGKSAAYIEVELITGTDLAFTLKGRLVRILSDGIAYDFLYTASLEGYDEYLEVAQGILDSVRFKSGNPVKEITFWDISMCYAENDVEATVSDEKVYLYYNRYSDNIPRFYVKHDDSMRYTDDMLDDPVRLQEFIQLWLLDLADPWFEENKNLQEVLRENIEINGKRAVHVVFLNDYRHIEITLFVHNNALYVILGKVEFGYKDALTSFIQPIIKSVRFAEP